MAPPTRGNASAGHRRSGDRSLHRHHTRSKAYREPPALRLRVLKRGLEVGLSEVDVGERLGEGRLVLGAARVARHDRQDRVVQVLQKDQEVRVSGEELVLQHVGTGQRAVVALGVEGQDSVGTAQDLDELPRLVRMLALRVDVPGSAAQLARTLAVGTLREENRLQLRQLRVFDRRVELGHAERAAL